MAVAAIGKPATGIKSDGPQECCMRYQETVRWHIGLMWGHSNRAHLEAGPAFSVVLKFAAME